MKFQNNKNFVCTKNGTEKVSVVVDQENAFLYNGTRVPVGRVVGEDVLLCWGSAAHEPPTPR
jgi:hypothetical protein